MLGLCILLSYSAVVMISLESAFAGYEIENCDPPCENMGALTVTTRGLARLTQAVVNFQSESIESVIKKASINPITYETPCTSAEINAIGDALGRIDALGEDQTNSAAAKAEVAKINRVLAGIKKRKGSALPSEFAQYSGGGTAELYKKCPGVPRALLSNKLREMFASGATRPEPMKFKLQDLKFEDVDLEISKVKPISATEFEVEVSVKELSMSTCANVQLTEKKREYFNACGLMARMDTTNKETPKLIYRAKVHPEKGTLEDLFRVDSDKTRLKIPPGAFQVGLKPLTKRAEEDLLNRVAAKQYMPTFNIIKKFDQKPYVQRELNGYMAEQLKWVSKSELPAARKKLLAQMKEQGLTYEVLQHASLPFSRDLPDSQKAEWVRELWKKYPQLMALPSFQGIYEDLGKEMAAEYEFNSEESFGWFMMGSSFANGLFNNEVLTGKVEELISSHIGKVDGQVNNTLGNIRMFLGEYHRAPLLVGQDVADMPVLRQRMDARAERLKAYKFQLARAIQSGDFSWIKQNSLKSELGAQQLGRDLAQYDRTVSRSMIRTIEPVDKEMAQIYALYSDYLESSGPIKNDAAAVVAEEANVLNRAFGDLDRTRMGIYLRQRDTKVDPSQGKPGAPCEGNNCLYSIPVEPIISDINRINNGVGESLRVGLYSSALPCPPKTKLSQGKIPRDGVLAGTDNEFDIASEVSVASINDWLRISYERNLLKEICMADDKTYTCNEKRVRDIKLSQPPRIEWDGSGYRLVLADLDVHDRSATEMMKKKLGGFFGGIVSAITQPKDGKVSLSVKVDPRPCTNGNICFDVTDPQGKARQLWEMGGFHEKLQMAVAEGSKELKQNGIRFLPELRAQGVRRSADRITVYWGVEQTARNQILAGRVYGPR
ncbi:MAG: hypothetical protein H6624_16025 [Bdellovibrionaceae bacterium]|nr:hypothetical protein [Bdellovibrionales bacterium]MCB9085856.1 hypothetical protein [Pseudobdellovibrionaceae bacterium]